ncbi:uncharacterized protein Z520_06660 [Fonsecaea multimorphosa CBS 102226]|uniref:Uncharacterized protein n=1 Tax=Fonsecaea multimorphosa CBS 102226 TaxID=1442371 RepID=A0A0D2JWI8_9EURO|nr:uncharacterized protein Z520_06660 [Fonsecaea multimorphosa CBS 102226]KIX97882.1 hypothetical protein Z520_06660 [Fonsecaea multimorphosa CBS 102226]OAL23649.1 hypothetical protein AYO22_06226 [Fonsecaea multimorphosa]
MAGVLDGLISSRRIRPSRSRSESAKQLHARWGDVAITAPNGGWTQHYLDDDLNTVTYQAHGSPDSQKTLVNNSPDLSFKDEIEKVVAIEAIRGQTPPIIQKDKSAITITIPLPWSRKSHRRSSSASSQQQQQLQLQQLQAQAAQVVDKVVTAESRPVRPSVISNIDEIIVAESRPATADPFRADSPIIHTQSPVYDDVSTFFTRAVFPEKHPGPTRLPQIQTSVPPNKSQPASALSILSPVAEKYNGLSESNNATPMDNTPIAQHIVSAIPVGRDGQVDMASLAGRLETHARRTTPPTLPSDNALDTAFERPDSRSTARIPSRPSSRGPGIGEVAYMRASSRGAPENTGGRRSASREPVARRAGSVEPHRQRAPSREALRRRADSPVRSTTSHSFSRRNASCEPVGQRSDSPPLVSRRALSREPAVRRAESPEPKTRRALSRGLGVYGSAVAAASPDESTARIFSDDRPVRPRAESPGPSTRRAHSRDASSRRNREVSPPGYSRRALSREPYTRRRISAEFSQRAVSVDPIVRRTSPRADFVVPSRHASPRNDDGSIFTRHASPREDMIPSRRGTPVVGLADRDRDRDSTPDSSIFQDLLTPDEATDIETETEEMYFESRKGWNGAAVAPGISSRGFYGDVVQDYKLIARDVEAEMAGSEVNLIKKDNQKESYKPKGELVREDVYQGPVLVPPQEELWG